MPKPPWLCPSVRSKRGPVQHAVRAARQRSQASLTQLSRELGINPKMEVKSRKRATVEDLKTGPTEPRSAVLTEAEEARVVAFRRHTLLQLDDCLYALQPRSPHLTRSALHRCLQGHGISRLPMSGILAARTRQRAAHVVRSNQAAWKHQGRYRKQPGNMKGHRRVSRRSALAGSRSRWRLA